MMEVMSFLENIWTFTRSALQNMRIFKTQKDVQL